MAHRESSKKMVKLAQETHKRVGVLRKQMEEPGPAAEMVTVPTADLKWLVDAASSLAGSVLSQADPND